MVLRLFSLALTCSQIFVSSKLREMPIQMYIVSSFVKSLTHTEYLCFPISTNINFCEIFQRLTRIMEKQIKTDLDIYKYTLLPLFCRTPNSTGSQLFMSLLQDISQTMLRMSQSLNKNKMHVMYYILSLNLVHGWLNSKNLRAGETMRVD